MKKFGSPKSFFATSLLSILVLFSSLTGPELVAQGLFTSPTQKDRLNNPFGQFNQGGPAANEQKVTFTAEFKVEKETGLGKIFVKAKMAPHWHIYSLHNPGNSLSTELKVENKALLQIGNFRTEKNPKVELIPSVDGDYFDESHEDEVVWVAPIQLDPEMDPKTVELNVNAVGQVCSTSCDRFTETATASYAGELEAGTLEFKQSATLPSIKQTGPAVGFTSSLKFEEGKDEGWIVVSGKIAPGYHLYSQQNTSGTIALTIALGDKESFEAIGNFHPSTHPHVYLNPVFKTFEESFDGDLKWIARVKLAEEVDPESIDLRITVNGQSCNDTGCQAFDEQVALKFGGYGTLENDESLTNDSSHTDEVATTETPKNAEAPKTDGKPADTETKQAQGEGLNYDKFEVEGASAEQHPFAVILLLALAGGFILNFMPCVLPVIGLKVMSFVNQAGKNRMQALTLNLWYVFGMLTVFMVLATLLVVMNLGWGQQSQNVIFNIVMVSVVFVMGLSFLGVWEIPIPGFVGTGRAAAVAQQEGPTAAFVKGIITTILAVPCSGPGLATALTYSAGKPAWIVYAIFLCIGLGMALPYIAIGLKPELIKFLPKPGPWMETFKQVMGFFLLGTVIFILSYISWEMRLATMAFLFGLWFSCWLIGRIPITADGAAKFRTWTIAAIFGVIFGFVSFYWIAGMSKHRFEKAVLEEVEKRRNQRLDVAEAKSDDTNTASLIELSNPDEEVSEEELRNSKVDSAELQWKPFSKRRLEDETARQSTVLVDFTADW